MIAFDVLNPTGLLESFVPKSLLNATCLKPPIAFKEQMISLMRAGVVVGLIMLILAILVYYFLRGGRVLSIASLQNPTRSLANQDAYVPSCANQDA